MPLIAVVDEDSMQRDMMSNLIRLYDSSCKVFEATSGTDLLKFIDAYKVDLVITELHLPDVDGLELIRRIRMETYAIPIIGIASNTQDFRAMAREAGAVECIEKPVNSDHLLADVQRLLKLNALKPMYNITIENILQVVSGKHEDCVLTILSGNEKGKAYFRNGELVHAHTLSHQGKEAVFEMLSWDLHHFGTKPMTESVDSSIKGSLMSILMDAAYESDSAQIRSSTGETHD